MLTVTPISINSANSYYSVEESYVLSEWFGTGADYLDLSGPVDAEDFASLLEGRSPDGELLTQNRASNRRAAFDLTLSAPKSVSIAAIALDDVDINNAHRDAVRDTLTEVEALTQARVKSGGKVSFLDTNNGIFASFEHTANRNLEPQLHTHSVLMNATRLAGQWRSLYAREIFQRIKKLGKFYRDRLGELVQSLGHKLRAVGDYWELASIPQRIVDGLSSRKREILEWIGDRTSKKVREVAPLVTRKAKQAPEIYQKPAKTVGRDKGRERN